MIGQVIKNIINFIKSNKSLITNTFNIFIIHGLNFLLPLITYPYIMRVLGMEKFGRITYALAVMQFFILFSDFGFTLTGVKRIGKFRNSLLAQSILYSVITTIKLGMFFIGGLILFIFIRYIPVFQNNHLLFMAAYLMIFANILYSEWYFVGLEKMKDILIFFTIIKILFVVMVFICIKAENDYMLYMFMHSMANIFIGVFTTIFIFFKYRLRYKLPSFFSIKREIRQTFFIFMNNSISTIYLYLNPIIIKLFGNFAEVGFYTSVEKIIKALQTACFPLIQALFANTNNLIHNNKKELFKLVRQVLILISGIYIIAGTFMMLYAGTFIKLYTGQSYTIPVIITRIYAFLPLIGNLSGIILTSILINFNKQEKIFYIYLVVSITGLVFSIFLTRYFGSIGTAAATVTIELILLLIFSKIALNIKKKYI